VVQKQSPRLLAPSVQRGQRGVKDEFTVLEAGIC
jgi:hypothetical protein